MSTFSNLDSVFEKLAKYNLQGFSHTDRGLIDHLKGTHAILEKWDCSKDLCLAGLCHSIYGTESYRRSPIDLSERKSISEIIGAKAEKTAYYFGAHVKDSLWKNLEKERNFTIYDRLNEQEVPICEEELKELITLTLANWLEQRPRAPQEHLFVRQEEFLKAENYLPATAFDDFKKAYGITLG